MFTHSIRLLITNDTSNFSMVVDERVYGEVMLSIDEVFVLGSFLYYIFISVSSLE